MARHDADARNMPFSGAFYTDAVRPGLIDVAAFAIVLTPVKVNYA